MKNELITKAELEEILKSVSSKIKWSQGEFSRLQSIKKRKSQ